jgi:hypothetical protein
MPQTRLQRAIAAIDSRNAGDPNTIRIRGLERKKEQAHAEMVSDWLDRLRPEASEPLRLAARAHHVRRWTIPRDSFPDGRAGYLQWRRSLQDVHAAELRAIMEAEGYQPAEINRAEHIIRKRELARDPEVQALEDALCLVFLETQFTELASRLSEDKMIGVLQKTMRKMSPQAISLALTLDLSPTERELLGKAAS